MDERLASGIKPDTVNGQLQLLQEFLRFLSDGGRPVAERMLKIQVLSARERIPKDASVDKQRRLLGEIERDCASCHAGLHRTGVLDRAWFLLMLHCGPRTGEVRRLRLADLDFERRMVRIEQSKGLKDREESPGHIVLEMQAEARDHDVAVGRAWDILVNAEDRLVFSPG